MITNQMVLSLNDARNSWNRIIREKKEEYNREYSLYEKRLNSTMLIFQILGTISTGIFFIIQLICSLLYEPKVVVSNKTTNFRKYKYKDDDSLDF